MKAFLRLTVDGATEEEETRGVNAAMAVFNEAGINPYDAAGGAHARAIWDDKGFPDNDEDFTDKEAVAATVWDQAEKAAMDACCEVWPADRPRSGDGLEVILDDATKAALYGGDDDDDDDLQFTPEQQAEYEAWLKAGKPMK